MRDTEEEEEEPASVPAPAASSTAPTSPEPTPQKEFGIPIGRVFKPREILEQFPQPAEADEGRGGVAELISSDSRFDVSGLCAKTWFGAVDAAISAFQGRRFSIADVESALLPQLVAKSEAEGYTVPRGVKERCEAPPAEETARRAAAPRVFREEELPECRARAVAGDLIPPDAQLPEMRSANLVKEVARMIEEERREGGDAKGRKKDPARDSVARRRRRGGGTGNKIVAARLVRKKFAHSSRLSEKCGGLAYTELDDKTAAAHARWNKPGLVIVGMGKEADGAATAERVDEEEREDGEGDGDDEEGEGGTEVEEIAKDEIVIRVTFFCKKQSLAREQELLVLGSQTLADLCDALVCPERIAELMAPGLDSSPAPRYSGACFLIENTFYPDRRSGGTDYGAPIIEWASRRLAELGISSADVAPVTRKTAGVLGPYSTADMEKTRIADVPMRLGTTYAFLHQADCEHRFTVTDVRIATADDLTPRSRYPRFIFAQKLLRPKCFPAECTRVLTNRGFLFLDEIEDCVREGKEVLYAAVEVGDEASARSLVFVPGTLVFPNGRCKVKQEFIEFTDEVGRRHWGKDSGQHVDGAELGGHSNHVSLLVTPDHEMYAQLGSKRGTTFHGQTCGGKLIDPTKYTAQSLLPDEKKAQAATVRFFANAAAGYSGKEMELNTALENLGLRFDSVGKRNAFIELYFFWLGDGSMEINGVRIGSTEPEDIAWIKETFGKIGLIEGPDWFEGTCGLSIKNESILKFFTAANGCKGSDDGPKAVKWFMDWVWFLGKDLLVPAIDALRRAEGSSTSQRDGGVIWTPCTKFRDDLLALLIRAGYTAHFIGHREKGTATANADGWHVSFSCDRGAVHPSLTCKGEITRTEKILSLAWCVAVEHRDHLIVAQRVERGQGGVVTKASRPVIVGQCAICNTFIATIITAEDEHAPESPCFWCRSCFENFHLDVTGAPLYRFRMFIYRRS